MNNVLIDLEPKKVFHFFECISNIPRCSGNERQISDYIFNFAKERSLYVNQDKALNILIKKPGTIGYEKSDPIILQGHMDMVCVKEANSKHNFSCEPLMLFVNGDIISAIGTSLGADNGIALAYGLALLDSKDISHPPLEVLFTTEEETGMVGIKLFDTSKLEGKKLIGLDAGGFTEGRIYAGCAGGVEVDLVMPMEWEYVNQKDIKIISIQIHGLKGGHSGGDIDKGRANAIKVLARILYDLNQNFELSVLDINGGQQSNNIPIFAEANVIVNHDTLELVKSEIKGWKNIFKNEFKNIENNLQIKVIEIEKKDSKALNKNTKNKVIDLLNILPDGVNTMSKEIEGLVESSSNIGLLTMSENTIHISILIRSSKESLKEHLVNKITLCGNIYNASIDRNGDYYGWEYNKNSELIRLFKDLYNEKYGKEPRFLSIHAGIECGILSKRIKDLDIIAVGPEIYLEHTYEEYMHINSVKKTWLFLLEILKRLK